MTEKPDNNTPPEAFVEHFEDDYEANRAAIKHETLRAFRITQLSQHADHALPAILQFIDEMVEVDLFTDAHLETMLAAADLLTSITGKVEIKRTRANAGGLEDEIPF